MTAQSGMWLKTVQRHCFYVLCNGINTIWYIILIKEEGQKQHTSEVAKEVSLTHVFCSHRAGW